MKHQHILSAGTLALALATAGVTTGCNDWLDLTPNNEQVTSEYWKSKEEVEAVVASGYYNMRQALTHVIMLGELRGGDLYTVSSADDSKVQNFDVLPTNKYAAYSDLYGIISMANSVIMYAPGVQAEDNTYYTSMMQSHLCEAYFQRAFAYLLLVKNWKEVPLILDAYVNDKAVMKQPKASESQIIAQIKADVQAALATGAAKGTYEEDWQTKGRATKWALYALMADVCLWDHDYDECIYYADQILEAKDALRPVFISDMANYYDIFYPGLSNESIFELYWDYNTEGKTNSLFSTFAVPGPVAIGDGNLNVTQRARERMLAETTEVRNEHADLTTDGRIGRMLMCAYTASQSSDDKGNSNYALAQNVWIWKYRGTDIVDPGVYRLHSDANYILYRVADVMLMKAEALVMKGETSWPEAVAIINRIRIRAGLPPYIDLESASAHDEILAQDEYSLLTEVMDQREMELIGEAKRWYDILRLARYDRTFSPSGTVEDEMGMTYANYRTAGFGQDVFAYKEKAIELITSSNFTTSPMQLSSVLQNSWAWYLPIAYSEISVNENLKQNPYYE